MHSVTKKAAVCLQTIVGRIGFPLVKLPEMEYDTHDYAYHGRPVGASREI